MAEGSCHALRLRLQVILLWRRRERHDQHSTVWTELWVLNLGHVMGQYEVTRAHYEHTLRLLVDHVRVGRDLGKHFCRIDVIIIDGAVALIMQGCKHLHE